MDILVFSLYFFLCYYQFYGGEFGLFKYYFNEKSCLRVQRTHQHVGGALALWVVRVAPPCSKNSPFLMSLKSPLYALHIGATRVGNGETICCRWDFLLFFLLFFLLPQKLQVDPLCCWYFNFSPYFFYLYFLLLAFL